MRMRLVAAVVLAVLPSVVGARHARAQMTVPAGTDGAVVRAEYLRDLAVLERKFTALAEALPPALFEWRPAPDIRSVHEVVALIAAENAALIPATFGQATMAGAPGGLQQAIAIFTARDRDALLTALRASFGYARTAWSALSEADMSRSWDFFGAQMSGSRVAFAIMTDQHEHLGQLVAYARMNGIAPPWSARAAAR